MKWKKEASSSEHHGRPLYVRRNHSFLCILRLSNVTFELEQDLIIDIKSVLLYLYHSYKAASF